jgi:ZIP family zinc transporter
MGGKSRCDEDGPCHGFSETCGQECYKVRGQGRLSIVGPLRRNVSRQPTRLRNVDEESNPNSPCLEERGRLPTNSSSSTRFASGSSLDRKRTSSTVSHQPHHHHVPSNAFLSIGLQTSIAIALHKLPEGFITYATNHANPKLGFAVFMALFIHNITEGFALALPLYLALNSRLKAIIIASLLGGLSQPAGAGVAAAWFKLGDIGNGSMLPGDRVYGCMFAVTSGIMTSVALQLFSESLGLGHNRNLCMLFAFVGMGILGVSFALTAE